MKYEWLFREEIVASGYADQTDVPNEFHLASRGLFAREVLDVAPEILGCVLQRTDDNGTVTIRITEVKAYI